MSMDKPASGDEPSGEPFKLIISSKYRRAFAVLVCILIGNLGYYFTRAHFVIVLPSLKDEGIMNNDAYGSVLIACYILNMIGKLVGGYLIDLTNMPKFSFVLFVVLASACALVFIQVPYTLALGICWSLTRLFTTIGKMGVIKIFSNYWPAAVMGTIIGISTVSCSIGEAISKATLAMSVKLFNNNWKQVLYLSVSCALVSIVPAALFVRDKKKSENPDVMHEDAELKLPKKQEGVDEITVLNDRPKKGPSVLRLLKNHRLLMLMAMNVFISCLREVFGAWSINFLKDELQTSNSVSGLFTAVFCFASAVGAMIGGRLIDSVSRKNRLAVQATCMFSVMTCLLFVALATSNVISLDSDSKAIFCIALITVGELSFGAPVSFVDGIYLVDIIDREEISFASGLVGMAGYVGAIAQTPLIKIWVNESDSHWEYVYFYAVACAGASVSIAITYLLMDRRKYK